MKDKKKEGKSENGRNNGLCLSAFIHAVPRVAGWWLSCVLFQEGKRASCDTTMYGACSGKAVARQLKTAEDS